MPAAKQFAEKSFSACHSERSEESVCAECQEKERFLVAPLLGMTRLGRFSATCKAALMSPAINGTAEAVPYKTWLSHAHL
jgi:hypothetical protein